MADNIFIYNEVYGIMITNQVYGRELSLLGFGTMRLPVKEDGSIDEEAVFEMVRYAVEHGVNYYDTAYPCHQGNAETVIGKALKQFPRESYCLVTEYPGHQIAGGCHPEEIFEEQLTKCGVDYFVSEKRQGRIKHLGFSCHGNTSLLREFLNKYGDKMEFCQIQLNYLDWTLQDGKGKYKLLTERNIPIWVMKPVREGMLAAFDKEYEDELRKLRLEASIASWAFRWLQDLPNVKMILDGMGNMEQLVDDIHTFERKMPLRGKEEELLMKYAIHQ